MNRVGEGALDDSDSDEIAEEDQEQEQEGIPEHVITHPVLERLRAQADNMGRTAPIPSPLSKLVARASKEREESPDGHLASDERSFGEFESDPESDNGDSINGSDHGSKTTTQRRSSSSTSASGSVAMSRSARSSLSMPRRPLHFLAKQESQASIRTITGVNQDGVIESMHSSQELGTATTNTSDNVEGASIRRPSPHPSRPPTISIPLNAYGHLGLSLNDGRSLPAGSSVSAHRMPSTSHHLTALHFKEIAWQALHDSLERCTETGDIQTCAALVLVAPRRQKGKENAMGLNISEERASRIVEAYVGAYFY